MNADDLRIRARVKSLVSGCTNCSLCQVGSGPIPFRGPSPAKIAVVGEAPGVDEDREHSVFIGASGRLATQWLSDAGINPESVAWINTVSCYPNRTPHPREVQACRATLEIQLRAVNPEWLLVLGGIATSTWWKVRLGDLRGLWWSVNDFGLQATAMATWHPAAVIRNWGLEKQAKFDVRTFARAVNEYKMRLVREQFCIICHREPVLRWDDDKNLGWCAKHDPMSGLGGGRKPAKRKPIQTIQTESFL